MVAPCFAAMLVHRNALVFRDDGGHIDFSTDLGSCFVQPRFGEMAGLLLARPDEHAQGSTSNLGHGEARSWSDDRAVRERTTSSDHCPQSPKSVVLYIATWSFT
eukprot:6487553-Amphidinium_carterae.4